LNHYLLAVCSTLILSIVVSPITSAKKEEENLIVVKDCPPGQTGGCDEEGDCDCSCPPGTLECPDSTSATAWDGSNDGQDPDDDAHKDGPGDQGGKANKPKDVKPKVKIDWGDVEKKNYTVRAKTLSDFCLQVSALSHAGQFNAKWDLHYFFKKKTGFVYEITISNTRTIHMPKWIGKNRREKKEQDAYESIINALWLHELGHNSGFERETKKLKQNLENLTNASQADCEMVKKLATASYKVLSGVYDTNSLFSPINCPITERQPAYRPPLDSR
jgi:hypothetical protein